MASLSIPERHQLGVSKIRDLDMDAVQAIRSALDKAAFDETSKQADSPSITALSSLAQLSLAKGDFKAISDALVSMYVVKSGRDDSSEEFSDRIADALEALPNPELRLEPNQRESFKKKIQVLLGAELFGVVSKIADLRTVGERIFCHARVMTDLRPVFGTDVDRGPAAMLVTHNLKIAFHETGRKGDHDIFITLDADDLNDLKEVILRAEAKAKALKSSVSENIKIYGVRE